MDNSALLKALMAHKMALSGQVPDQGTDPTPRATQPGVIVPEVTQNSELPDAPVQGMGQPERSLAGELTQTDKDEARRQALERLKLKTPQKLDFTGQ